MSSKAFSNEAVRAARERSAKPTQVASPLTVGRPPACISSRRLLTSNTDTSSAVRMSYWSPSTT
jgi:hypothetical protein